MSRAKIAPRLRRAIFDPPWDPSQGAHEAACHELRDLLAVANAVGRAKRGAWFDRQMVEANMERAFAAHDRLVRRAAPRGNRRTRP